MHHQLSTLHACLAAAAVVDYFEASCDKIDLDNKVHRLAFVSSVQRLFCWGLFLSGF